MLTSWPGITPCAQPELDDGMTVPSSSWGRGCPRGHLLTRLWDPEWGPAFWKTNAYAPYPIWLWLTANAVHTFFWRWFHRLPTPFTADDLQAGYAYELAFRQFEVSDTRVFDRSQTGRAFFEGVIRDHLDLALNDFLDAQLLAA